MLDVLLPGNPMVSRVRPARAPRWRRYLPGVTLAVAALFPLLAPGRLIEPLALFGLSLDAVQIFLTALAVLLGMLAAILADRSPVPTLILGAFAVSLGGNLLSGRLAAFPLFALGLSWIAVAEARRLFEGITLAPDGLTLHRPLRDPLILEYAEIRAVHTSLQWDEAGTLILETNHGTVTAGALPHCEELQARVEARMQKVPVRATTESLDKARRRIQNLVDAEGRPA